MRKNILGKLKQEEFFLTFEIDFHFSDLRAKLEIAIDNLLNCAVRVAQTSHCRAFKDHENSSSVTSSDGEEVDQVTNHLFQ